MNDYPSLCISREGYAAEPDDGSSVERAEDGTPHIQRFYSVTQYSFTLRHPLLDPAERQELLDFYAANRSDYVRYVEPDTGTTYKVLLSGPPRPIDRVRGLITYEVRMTGSQIV